MKKVMLLFSIIVLVTFFAWRTSKKVRNIEQKNSINQKEKISALFSHGFWDYASQVDNYKDFFSFDLNTFSYPDAQDNKIRLSKVNLAQEHDIQTLKTAQKKYNANVFVGLSRGASTIITFLSENEVPGLKAVILESPFDTMENVVKSLVCKRMHMGWIPGFTRFCKFIIPWIMREYKRDGIKPINVVHKLPKELPILLICSLEDSLVPASSTIALYNRLCKTDHKNVHLLILDSGKHSKLVFGPDLQRYKEVVHAFCKDYGLPYDKQLASAGQSEYQRCKAPF